MEATSCPKGGNMWRYWYGLTQAWGSTTYDWALGQILPRCREEVLPAEPDRELCQREDTGLPWGKPYRGRIHIWDYPEGIRPYGHLAQYRGWPETRFTVRGTELEEKKVLVSPGEGEWHSKRDTSQFFPPITYPIHGKRLAQRGDFRILRRCSVSPSPQLCRCLPKRRRVPTYGRRQHSEWSEPSPPGGKACLAISTPRWRPPLSCGPTSVWRQTSLFADFRGRQRAAQSFWSSGFGPRICAMLLRDTVTLRQDLPPPRAVLAGSPPDRRRTWLERWARIQAGVSRQCESIPARTQGTLCLPKTLGGPRAFDGSERCLADRNFSFTESSGSKGPLWSPARMIERSQEGTRGILEGFILLAPFRNLTMRSCYPRDRPSTASWWDISRCRVTAYAPTFLAGKKSLLQLCIFGGLLGEKNISSRTDSVSVRRFALLKEL